MIEDHAIQEVLEVYSNLDILMVQRSSHSPQR